MEVRRMRPKQKPKILPLDKKIKPNPKYENIRPTIDTGNNTRTKVERMEEIRQFYKFRPDEIFRRITVTSLVTLMLEQSKLEYQEEDSAKMAKQIQEDQESLVNGKTPVNDQEAELEAKDEDAEADLEGCDADSLESPDSAIDEDGGQDEVVKKEETIEDKSVDKQEEEEEEDDGMIESVVFKGKRIPKLQRTNSHHHSSVGDLLQGIGDMVVSSRSTHNLFTSSYHHHDSKNAAETFNLDQVTPKAGINHNVQEVLDKIQHEENPTAVKESGDNLDHPALPKKRDRPYLILDIRDVDDYKRGRIVTSKSYPFPRITRSVNFESKDMLRFKNVEGKLIVVVDADESMAGKFATTLIQRGYDNVFVLSGGLRVASIKFPDQLVMPLKHDVDDEDDFDEQIEEDQIHVLEAFLEEALTSGTSRLSSMAPSVSSRAGWPSRISSSQSNLPSLINSGEPGFTRHKPRQVPLGINYYPPRPQRTSFMNSRRS